MIAPSSDTPRPAMLKSFWLMVPVPNIGASSQPPEHGADDADDHVQDHALLPVRSHDHAGDPADQAALR
jgi:hypothetical protein